MHRKMAAIVSWTLVLLWMLLIFKFSNQAADKSNGLSIGVADIIINAIKGFLPGEAFSTDNLNHIVRKAAHFTAYLILSILSCNALMQSGIKAVKNFISALGICVLYAASDEVHQLFISGRSGQPADVLIDSLGAVVGIGIYMLLKKYNMTKGTV